MLAIYTVLVGFEVEALVFSRVQIMMKAPSVSSTSGYLAHVWPVGFIELHYGTFPYIIHARVSPWICVFSGSAVFHTGLDHRLKICLADVATKLRCVVSAWCCPAVMEPKISHFAALLIVIKVA